MSSDYHNQYMCPMCNGDVYYSFLYDSFYCATCNAWVEVSVKDLNRISDKIYFMDIDHVKK